MRWQLDRAELFDRDDWTCCVCGRPLFAGVPQLAHRIGQTKANLQRYGRHVIHHPLNLASVCSLECNAEIDVTKRPADVDMILKSIYDDLEAKNVSS